MAKFTHTQYKNSLQKTSKPLKDVMFADETAQAIDKISSRQNIGNKNFNVAAVVGYVLVGLVPIKRFIQALKEEAGLSEDVAKNVAHDIRSEILAPVAQELAAIQEEAERNWQNAHSATDDEQPEARSGKSETLNPKSEINSKPKNSEGEVNEPSSTNTAQKPGGGTAGPPSSKDESVAREVFPAPDVKEDKFEKGPEGEMPEEKKDERF